MNGLLGPRVVLDLTVSKRALLFFRTNGTIGKVFIKGGFSNDADFET